MIQIFLAQAIFVIKKYQTYGLSTRLNRYFVSLGLFFQFFEQ